jgi:hypothetical protein
VERCAPLANGRSHVPALDGAGLLGASRVADDGAAAGVDPAAAESIRLQLMSAAARV